MNVAANQPFRRTDGVIVCGAFALVTFIAFSTRLAWRDAPIQRDVGIWAYHGWRMNEGAVLYRDLWENKPPGVFLTFGLIERLAGDGATSVMFWLDPVLTVAICAAIYWAARSVAGRIAASIAIVPACLVLCHRVLADWGLNTEKFTAVFEALALGFVLRLPAMGAAGSWRGRALAAGALIGLGAAFKQTGVILLVLVVGYLPWRSRAYAAFRARVGLLIAGFALVWAVIAAWLVSNGAVTAFLKQVVLFDLVRASSPEQDAKFNLTESHVQFVLSQLWLASPLLLPALAACITMGRKHLSEVALPLAHAAAICILFAIVPVGYGHYLLQAAPGAAVVLAFGLTRAAEVPHSRVRSVVRNCAGTIAIFSQAEFVRFAVDSDYEIRAAYRTLKSRNTQLVEAIRANTAPTDAVLVWPADMAASFEARRATPMEIGPAIPLFIGRPELLDPPMPVITQHFQSNPPEVIIDWSPIGVEPAANGEMELLTPISGLSLADPPNEQHPRAEGRAVAPLKHWIREHYGGQTQWGEICTIYRRGEPWREWRDVLLK